VPAARAKRCASPIITGIAIFNLARPEHVERLSRHCIAPTR
jgi:hypothetical protein